MYAGLPLGSLFREKVAIGTFLQIWVLKGSLLCVKGPYFTIFNENNEYLPGKIVKKTFKFLFAKPWPQNLRPKMPRLLRPNPKLKAVC